MTCGFLSAQQCDMQPGFLLEKISLSGAWLSATNHEQTYSGDLIGLNTWDPCSRTVFETTVSYDANKKGAGIPTITRNYDGRLQHIQLFPKHSKYFWYIVADEYHNNTLGILFRQSYGSGFGVTNDRFEFDTDFRLANEQFYKPGHTEQVDGFALKPRYSVPLNFIAKNSVLVFGEEFVPVFQSKAWYSNAIGVLSLPFKPKWSFIVSVSDNYLRNAPDTFRRNYMKMTIGFQYSFMGLTL